MDRDAMYKFGFIAGVAQCKSMGLQDRLNKIGEIALEYFHEHAEKKNEDPANNIDLNQATRWSRDFELPAFKTTNGTISMEILVKTKEFLLEEMKETIGALDLIIENSKGDDRSMIKADLIAEAIDGADDVTFVAQNLKYKLLRLYGFSHDLASHKVALTFDEVCRTNNAKRDENGNVILKDGKIQKPIGWQPPAIKSIIFGD